MGEKWYAAKLRELTFEEMEKSLLNLPDTYEICQVTEGTQAHLMNPRPVAWGYFDTEKEAMKAVEFDRFPSYEVITE